MLVPICAKSPYAYRYHHTSMGPHTHMVIFPAPYVYIHKTLIVATLDNQFMQKTVRVIFQWNCLVVEIFDCLSTVISHDHN